LLDRLAFDVIHVPPLRARPEDISTLAYHFAINITSELKRAVFPGFSAQASAALLAHEWPGNVRELKNAVERSVYREDDPDQEIDEILFDPFASPFAPSLPPPESKANAPELKSVPKLDRLPRDFRAAVDEYEKNILLQTLERAQYKQTTAAEMLNLSYHQLRGLLKKHELLGRKQQK
jgi:psp operon transcriptional activator